MVRRSLNGSKSVNYLEKEESEDEDKAQQDSEDEDRSGRKSSPNMEYQEGQSDDKNDGDDDVPLKKRKLATSSSPASKRKSRRKSSPRKIVHEETSDFSENEDNEEESYSPKKRNSPKKSSNGSSLNKRKKISPRVQIARLKYQEDEQEDSIEDPSSDDDDYIVPKKKSPQKSGKLPPVSEMVIESIKALKDNPKTGSSFSSIKDTISRNWSVDMKSYIGKIKKYIETGEKNGEIIRTKGRGFNARFTARGMKRKKPKASSKLNKKFDVDEVEYVPAKTLRDEERMKDKEELERRREERALLLEKALEDKASRPKQVKPKKEFWEVQSIQGAKVKNGINYYLVKYERSSKPQWEPEENVQNCWDLVEMFLKEDELRRKEIEKKRRECEEKGEYEVQRILEVKINKKLGIREFLIRWKGYSASDDSWENEEDLQCPELIKAFMEKVEETKNLSQKSLRLAPKKIDRLAFTNSRRLNKSKRSAGIRVTYEDME